MAVRSDDGATAVEIACVLPVVLTLLGAIITFALTMVYSGLTEYAARSGLRTAVLHSPQGYADTRTDPATGKNAVEQAIDDLFPVGLLSSPSSIVIHTTVPSSATTPGQGDTVTVTVTYDVPGIRAASHLVPNFLPSLLQDKLASLATITRSATGRRE